MKAALCFAAVICSFALGMLVGIWIPMTAEHKKMGDKDQQPGVLTPPLGSASPKDQKTADLLGAARAALRLEGKAQLKQLAALTQDYATLEAGLLHEFHNATRLEQKCAVVFLMGWYRSTVCVPDLAANVTLKYESKEDNHKQPLLGMYPVADALRRIGKPAIKAMLANIETGKDAEFRRFSTRVILQIEGAEVARFILELELKKTKDETGRKRFQEALDYLEKAKG